MSTPHLILRGVMAVAMTLDLDATRRATASAPLRSTYAVDTPAPDLTFVCQSAIAGTWMITDVSIESAVSSPPRCPGRRIDALVGTGTLVLNRDGTFADTTGLTVQATSFIPTSSRAPSCAVLEAQIATHDGIRSVSCADGMAGACACADRINPMFSPYRFTGRYTVRDATRPTGDQCAGPNVLKARRTGEGGVYVMTLARLES
jgi:hypothetical protein